MEPLCKDNNLTEQELAVPLQDRVAVVLTPNLRGGRPRGALRGKNTVSGMRVTEEYKDTLIPLLCPIF